MPFFTLIKKMCLEYEKIFTSRKMYKINTRNVGSITTYDNISSQNIFWCIPESMMLSHFASKFWVKPHSNHSKMTRIY